ncbi:unnamed protein product [Ostreobium quekettii]|uniref:protein-serine/threonine phosphatase n=1 Tax=Ostreobium quekettii TaxID=121088 RepID=A0A8S1J8H9_9CHLO|nr:unnamed protein product [Ostreobium quekettii]
MGGAAGARGSVEFRSLPPGGGPGPQRRPEGPATKFSACQRLLQDEDVVFVHERLRNGKSGPAWSLYCVCDGHGGTEAANHVRARLWKTLGPRLPESPLPEMDSPDFEQFALKIRTAMVNTFVKIGEKFVIETCEDKSGAAMTVTLLCGRLLTVANVGDADAVVDTGTESFMATVNHSIQSNEAERKRLAAAGAHLASAAPSDTTRPAGPEEEGQGPIRCWPGGSTLSRSIGDVEAGEHVLACPHVFQMALPRSGARVLMGSSGLWSLIGWKKATQVARRAPIDVAASKVVDWAIKSGKGAIQYDTSAVVVDAMPQEAWGFPSLVRHRAAERRAKYLCGCRCAFGKADRLGSLRLEVGCDGSQIVAHIDGRLLVSEPEESPLRDSFSSLAEITCGGFDGEGDSSTPRTRTPGRRSAGYSQSQRNSCSSRRDSQEGSRRPYAPGTPVDVASLPERHSNGWMETFRPRANPAPFAFFDPLPQAPTVRARELPTPFALADQLPPTPRRHSESTRQRGAQQPFVFHGQLPAVAPLVGPEGPGGLRRTKSARESVELAPGTWGPLAAVSQEVFSFQDARLGRDASLSPYGGAVNRACRSTSEERGSYAVGRPAWMLPFALQCEAGGLRRPMSATGAAEGGPFCQGGPSCRPRELLGAGRFPGRGASPERRSNDHRASTERQSGDRRASPELRQHGEARSAGPLSLANARPNSCASRIPGRVVPFTMRPSEGEPGGDVPDGAFNRDGWEVPMHSQAFRNLLLQASVLLGRDQGMGSPFEGSAAGYFPMRSITVDDALSDAAAPNQTLPFPRPFDGDVGGVMRRGRQMGLLTSPQGEADCRVQRLSER